MSRFYTLLLVVFCSHFGFGQKDSRTIYLTNHSPLEISSMVSMYEDTTNKLTFYPLFMHKERYNFTRINTNEVHIPYSFNTFWLHFRLKSTIEHAQNVYLEIDNSTIDYFRLYIAKDSMVAISREMGIRLPFESRPIPVSNFLYNLYVDSAETINCYIEVKPNGDALNFPITIHTQENILKEISSDNTLVGIIIGFIMALILIACFSLYMNSNEFTYLYFALYSIFCGLWILINEGFAFHYLWGNWPAWNRISLPLIPLISCFFFSKFAGKYMKLRDHSNVLFLCNKYVNWSLIVTMALIPLNLFALSVFLKIVLSQVVFTALLSFASAVLILKENKRTARYYIFANIPLIVSVVLLALNISMGVSSIAFRSTSMKIALAFQTFVLLFSLFDQIRDQQKKSENRLKESQQQYLDILENAIEAIFIIQDEKIQFCNTQFSIYMKYPREDINYIPFLALVSPSEQAKVDDMLTSRLKGRDSDKKIVFKSVDKEGYESLMEMHSVLITWERRPALLNFMNDISQIAKSEKDRQRLEIQLIHAQKLETIGTLAGGIAHDFNNILTPIIGYSEIVLDSLPEGSDIREDVEHIHTSAFRAKDLIKQILSFSRQIDTSREIINVNTNMRELSKLLDAVLPSSITLDVEYSLLEPHVNINPTQFHQVLMNLCTNAYQAISASRGCISVCIDAVYQEDLDQVTAQNLKEGEYASICISDNGVGMDQSIRKRIFDPFFTTKKTGEGTGLGLSVAYGIIKNAGGVITCDSVPGEGSTFTVFLPLHERPAIESTVNKSVITRGSEKILVVDDEVEITTMIKRMLEKQGYQVETSNYSPEAVDIISKKPGDFKLVVTDISMPVMNGVELAKIIREINSNVKIIFVSGFLDPAYTDLIMNIPTSRLLTKPIDSKTLNETIVDLIGNKAVV